MKADGSVCKYVGSRTFKGKNSGEDLFTLTVADEMGQTMQFFVNKNDYMKAKDLSFGNDLQLIFEIYPRDKGVGVRCTDLVVD